MIEIKNKLSNLFNKIMNILFNIITLNKLPMKGSLIYFILLLLGIISSIIIRYFYINNLILPFPEYINNCIIFISILYSLFLFFNYLIITSHAFKLINFFFIEKKNKKTTTNINMIFIGYYLYYYYITFVTSFVVIINYNLFLKINIFAFNYYMISICLIFIVSCYFILYKVNFNYDINKVLSFTGKFCLFSIFSLFFIYLYFIYNGLLFKFFNFCSPFKTIYCETSSAEAENELNRNLSSSNDPGKIVKTNNNSHNHNSTNLNESNHNSNIGNNNNNNTGIHPTNSNNNQQPNTNLTTTTRTETHTFAYTIQNNNNNNFSDENLPYLDSRSSTPTPTNTRINLEPYIQQTIENKTSQSKYSNWKFSFTNIKNVYNEIMDYIKMKDANDLKELKIPKLKFLKDSFYSDTNIMIDNNDLLDNAIDIKIFKLTHTGSLLDIVDELKILSDNGKLHSDNLLVIMNTILNAILEQSSENKDFFYIVKNKISLMLHQIQNNENIDFNSFPNLLDILNNKLIYLNGNYSFFKKITLNGEISYLKFNFLGTNKYSLINNIQEVYNEYMSKVNTLSEIQKIEKLNIYKLLNDLKVDFHDKYKIIYSESNYIDALDTDLDSNLFEDYLDNINNLVFHKNLDAFRIRYNFDHQTNETLINCDSIFKLRYWIFDKQNSLLNNYKRICTYNNWQYELLNSNQIIPKNIWNLINELDNEYNYLSINITNKLNISSTRFEQILDLYIKIYNIHDIFNRNPKLLNEEYFNLIINRIIKNNLLDILKKQQLNIELQQQLKLKTTGLDESLVENNKDNLFLKS
jgi:hypothetical protein